MKKGIIPRHVRSAFAGERFMTTGKSSFQESRSLGFIPFVSNRALDIYLEPYP
jgi:hypothetical protein